MDENKLIENIFNEFEKTNNQINELVRIQNELSNSENELIALQIRYVHKCKENDDLKLQIEKKNKTLNEKSNQNDQNLERCKSVEFHYNELQSQHNLCLEAMSRQQEEIESLKNKVENLSSENKRIENEKQRLKGLFSEQIEDLENNIKKLLQENDKCTAQMREYRNKYGNLESELENANQTNRSLTKSRDELRTELDNLRGKFSGNMCEKATRIEQNEAKISQLELDLTKSNSKLDEVNYELSEAKKECSNLVKQSEIHQKALKQKEVHINELKLSYETSLIECQKLMQINLAAKEEFEFQMKELQNQLNSDKLIYDQELKISKKRQKLFLLGYKTLMASFNDQQIKLENVIEMFKTQEPLAGVLRSKIVEVKKKVALYRDSQKSASNDQNLQFKSLQEKCMDLETSYFQKCEHLNALEREIYSTRNSLDSALNEIATLNNILTNKNDEIIMKNQTINRMEQIIGQLNQELNKRKSEICDRIGQIEMVENRLKEEKTVLDLKMAHLEANLKSKSQQLQERIDQIKELTQIVDGLTNDKERCEQKQNELITGLKSEINSKNTVLKELESELERVRNELNTMKTSLETKQIEIIPIPPVTVKASDSKIFSTTETQTDRLEHFYESISVEDGNLDASFSDASNRRSDDEKKNLHIVHHRRRPRSPIKNYNDDSMRSESSEIEELRINLKVKGNIIDSINDTLVIREAEIARLKARISMMERKLQMNDMTQDDDDDDDTDEMEN